MSTRCRSTISHDNHPSLLSYPILQDLVSRAADTDAPSVSQTASEAVDYCPTRDRAPSILPVAACGISNLGHCSLAISSVTSINMPRGIESSTRMVLIASSTRIYGARSWDLRVTLKEAASLRGTAPQEIELYDGADIVEVVSFHHYAGWVRVLDSWSGLVLAVEPRGPASMHDRPQGSCI